MKRLARLTLLAVAMALGFVSISPQMAQATPNIRYVQFMSLAGPALAPEAIVAPYNADIVIQRSIAAYKEMAAIKVIKKESAKKPAEFDSAMKQPALVAIKGGAIDPGRTFVLGSSSPVESRSATFTSNMPATTQIDATIGDETTEAGGLASMLSASPKTSTKVDSANPAPDSA
ncbi:MAG: hypothetical protein V4465_02540 [Patescibacteria group bacterium]